MLILSLEFKMRDRAVQLEMLPIVEAPGRPAKRSWGGAREGAGRPRKAAKDRTFVPHHSRPTHKKRHPTHITLRARRGLPNFRSQRVHDMLRRILERQLKERPYRDQFQVVHYSIQTNHLHLIVESRDTRAMRSGVSGLVIAFAKRLNALLRRRIGKVWSDRYHSRELTTPSEVRRALVYVLQNVRKHGFDLPGAWVDPLSTAHGFRGWNVPVEEGNDPDRLGPRAPRTWLLGEGWSTRGGGLLSPTERPA
jgi:REP element-mobilizing transposase RayT